jgi:trimeric autotransporter adhesin
VLSNGNLSGVNTLSANAVTANSINTTGVITAGAGLQVTAGGAQINGSTTVNGNISATGVVNANGFNANGGTVSNIAAGVAPNDAVNVQQLSSGLSQAVAQSNTYADVRANQALDQAKAYIDDKVFNSNKTAYRGVASAAALAAMPDVQDGKRVSIGVGVGRFEGISAIALGVKANVGSNGRLTLGAGVSSGAKTFSAGAGFSY